MTRMLNISTYQFKALDQSNLPQWRQAFLNQAKSYGLKGSILLSVEGINCFLSGVPHQVHAMIDYLNTFGFALEAKESFSQLPPFKRMLVKIKHEIIAMGAHKNQDKTAAFVAPETFKQWMSDNDCVVLDTRNDYEIRLGTFEKAIELNIKSFRDFPRAIAALKKTLPENKKIVTFCTGGIRCEKAALHMEAIGYNNVYQLEGGILKYFEKCGQAYYEGECFVFDKRVAVDAQLKETSSIQCFKCRQPLTEAMQAKLVDHQCPYCKQSISDQFVTSDAT